MGRRTVLLISALLVAALGTALVVLYVRGADERAAEGQELVEVLFAKADIPTGTTGQAAAESGALELREVARNSVAAGAISDITPVATQVALSPIFTGQQILTQQFGEPGQTTSLPIPEGKMAVSVQLGDPERVAGFVTSGSEVAVFLTIDNPTAGANEATATLTQVLLPRVTVIGVGSTSLVTLTTTDTETGEQNAEEIPKAILTLAVDQAQAGKLIYGTQNGTLHFGLLTEDSVVAPGGGVTGQNLFR
jgi:pilus assembly protein CpaB